MRRDSGADPIAQIRRDMDRAEKRRAASARAAGVAAVALVAVTTLIAGVGFARPAEKPPALRLAKLAPSAAAATSPASVPPQPEVPATAATETPGSPEPAPEAAKSGALAEAPRPREKKPDSNGPTPQKASIAIGETGYEPSVIRVKRGVPISLTVGKGEGCAAGFLMPDLGISADNSRGRITVRLPALAPGTYRFTCGMDMVSGELVVR